jgi:zinc transport system substrate-binding protein
VEVHKVLGGLLVAGVLAGSPGVAAAEPTAKVVASFYPVAYAAQRVGGDRVAVTNLTPTGAEPHDLELTPKQIDEILDARVVLTMGHRFQPAVEKAAEQRDGETVTLLDHLPIHAGNRAVREGDPGALDPHVWLDPVLMQGIVSEVRHALTKADPAGRATYARNAQRFTRELAALDADYRTGLAHCSRNLLVTSHEAFGYLARRYGLTQEGVSGLSPDSEPDARRIAQLADLVKRQHVTVVFTESLVSPRIAGTLAREAGVKTDTLDPLEGLTDREVAAGATYGSVMRRNLTKIRRALSCT